MFYNYPFQYADEQLKQWVWQKGQPPQPPYDPSEWRFDICGTPMKYSDHGNRSSEHGWEIDHIMPASMGGSSDLSNLQPLNWKNNADKGDQFPWFCP